MEEVSTPVKSYGVVWECVDTWTLGGFYLTVVQVVFLFGSESWVLSTSTEGTVEGTHTGVL